MTGRDRVLEALAGGRAGGVAVHFEFGHLAERLCREGIDDPDAHFGVDLKKVWFLPEEGVSGPGRQPAEPARPAGAPRIGDAAQIASYRLWNYMPDSIDRRHPLADARIDELDRCRFPTIDSPAESRRLREIVRGHHARGLAVAGQAPHLGGVIFETAYRLRGLDNLLEDLRTRAEFAEALLERITAAAARNAAELAAADVDIVLLGDDIGTPTSMLISPDSWRRWFKPRLVRVIQAARATQAGVAVAYHSDGWLLPVIDDLVEIGVGILNPVQPDCMDPAALRRRFGRRLTLWGTVGAATLLPFGTPAAVYQEVRRRAETLGDSGGLILAPAYDLEDNVPVANARAFFAACRPDSPSG